MKRHIVRSVKTDNYPIDVVETADIVAVVTPLIPAPVTPTGEIITTGTFSTLGAGAVQAFAVTIAPNTTERWLLSICGQDNLVPQNPSVNYRHMVFMRQGTGAPFLVQATGLAGGGVIFNSQTFTATDVQILVQGPADPAPCTYKWILKRLVFP